MCFNGFPMAVTKDGYLVPCCYCDVTDTMQDSKFKKLLAVSKISDYDSIQEILDTKEWKLFERNLKENKGPPACMRNCQKDVMVRQNNAIDPKTNKLKQFGPSSYNKGK